MNWVKETKERTNKVARDWTKSGRKFGYPSADRFAKELKSQGKLFIRSRR